MKQPPGPGVDAQGRQVPDPTANVIALTEAAVKRLDDIGAVRDEFEARFEDQRRYYEDQLRELNKELRKAESDRIDAIRAVDVGNVQRAADVSSDQAEAIRQTVASTATAFDAKLSAVLEPIQKRIEDLSRAQYEQAGQKQQVVETRHATGASSAVVFGAIAAGATIIGLVISFVLFITNKGSP